VDFDLSEDQELFRETTVKFLEDTCPLTTVREWAESEAAGFPRSWWKQGCELGWTSMLISEADGGGSVSGQGLVDLSLVAEEMGRMVSPGPFVTTSVVADVLSRVGTSTQKDAYLPGILDGEIIGSWCVAEPNGSWLPEDTTLEAVKKGDAFHLTGTKGPVEAADVAGVFVVTARVDGEPTHFILGADTPGVRVTKADGLDLVRRFGMVEFNDVVLSRDNVLGDVGAATEQWERGVEVANVLQAASMAGAMDKVLSMTIEYAFDRYSFGRPLASYQALKHRFADMKMWLEAVMATSLAAAEAAETRPDRSKELVSVAKAYVGERVPWMMQDCVQLHGGIGVTWDHDLHLYLRRAVQDRSLYGSPDQQRERIASGLDLEESNA